ncbi:uncharacterized protein LOC133266219 [Pezoporus flaviventris]|uniref:uncharacterized protein LOC133266219 n=1 Tax=Pezoporus flaviventris TaxID=889875 RepID=UPI002AB03210|nr:uncharacterized protein LOC133266219 [Pezoporus flaviventris]
MSGDEEVRVPSAQECQESPEECVRAGGSGTPDTPRSRRPAGGSSPTEQPLASDLSAPQPGQCAAGTRTWRKEPPLFTAGTENSETVRSHRSVFPELPRPSAAHSARSPQGRHSRRSPAQLRGTLGGKACPDPVLHRPPRALPAVVEGEPCCSPLPPERKRHPPGLWERACLTERGGEGKPPLQLGEPPPQPQAATQHGDVPCACRAPLRSRHSPVPPGPGHLCREKTATRCTPTRRPELPSQPATALPTRPEPPHPVRGFPVNFVPLLPSPRQARSPLELENGLPAPSSGGGGCRSRARAGPGRGGARRGALPQN